MSDIDTLTAQRVRRRGQRMTAQERKQAQDIFIKALSNTANVRAACMQAKISHSIVYQWQEHDPEFGIRFREANTDASWLLFGEAWRRAMTGEKKYVTSQGKQVYDKDGNPLTYQEKSDRLLELLLKARLPEFREKQRVEMSGPDGSPIQTNSTTTLPDLSMLTGDQLAQLKSWLQEAKVR